MSINLHHFIIHGLKHTSQDEFIPVYQEQELPLSDAATQILLELHQRFNAKPSKGIGRFSKEKEVSFISSLSMWQADPESFVGFSKQTCATIADKMQDYGLANDCYLLMAEYHYVAQRFLLIAELPIKEKVTCSDQFEINRFRFLDADAMQLAVRFDLQALQADPESNYAVFVKGRAGRKVADFFLDALAVEEAIDRRAQAEQLSKAVNDYCQTHVEGQELKTELKKEVVSFCKEQQVAGETVFLNELSQAVSTHAEVSFADFIASRHAELPEQLDPEVKTLQRLTRFAGTGKGVSISFDASLFGGRVTYDLAHDRLVITEIPPNLKDQLIQQLQQQREG